MRGFNLLNYIRRSKSHTLSPRHSTNSCKNYSQGKSSLHLFPYSGSCIRGDLAIIHPFAPSLLPYPAHLSTGYPFHCIPLPFIPYQFMHPPTHPCKLQKSARAREARRSITAIHCKSAIPNKWGIFCFLISTTNQSCRRDKRKMGLTSLPLILATRLMEHVFAAIDRQDAVFHYALPVSC